MSAQDVLTGFPRFLRETWGKLLDLRVVSGFCNFLFSVVFLASADCTEFCKAVFFSNFSLFRYTVHERALYFTHHFAKLCRHCEVLFLSEFLFFFVSSHSQKNHTFLFFASPGV